MQYQIVETQPYQLFGMDVMLTDGWKPEKFSENAELWMPIIKKQ